ncbi:hypothetical protein FS935_02670 [Metabacillus litoralis]|uniref:Bacterial Pleckstrin homology domain-containing protein n=1 Tax=Metabacillus litoralis TaxID=152268 RepID=A0A5C6W708_9BACI|nr:hypothetical protein [Metabacillus litoralis]TXC93113.1 hypothetical protein FS935_02670 [Metabacillus litoralis]
MEIIAKIPYVIVNRKIEDNTQLHKEEEHKITLSCERVVTSFDSFLLEEVLDISFRFFSSEEMGLLYLHTTKGMYSYTVKTSPQHFIEQFKQMK